jgi:hypothetical protein
VWVVTVDFIVIYFGWFFSVTRLSYNLLCKFVIKFILHELPEDDCLQLKHAEGIFRYNNIQMFLIKDVYNPSITQRIYAVLLSMSCNKFSVLWLVIEIINYLLEFQVR